MRAKHSVLFVASGLVAGVFGCNSGATEPEVPLSLYGGTQLSWAECPAQLGGPSVQCTQAQVPLDWHERRTEYTSILLRKVPALGKPLGTLWALDGGPGFAGDGFLNETIIELARDAGLDLMVPSHRGTIGASALSCGAQQPDSEEGGRITLSEWPTCLAELENKWGKGLPQFTVRQAALDVAYLMDLLSSEAKSYVFGGSYGTLWAHRVLLDTDAQPDAVLLDSIVPIGATLERVDAHADQAAEAVLSACSEIASCAKRFEGDPVSLGRAAISAYAQGEGCGGEDLSGAAIQQVVHALLNGSPDSWIKLISLFERLVRCNSQDAESLLRLLNNKRPSAEEGDSRTLAPAKYNGLLNRQILYRELFRFDVTEEQRADFEATALALGTSTSLVRQEASAFGPGYRRVDEPKRATSSVPTYLLSGRFDPLDPPPWAAEFTQSLTSGRLTQVLWAGHSTLRYLGWAEGGCGRHVFSSFLSGAPDFDCVAAQSRVDLGMEEPETQSMIDAWWSATEPSRQSAE